MPILVYGTGAVGAYLGSRLARVGNLVTFLARPAWAQALQGRGLRVEQHGASETIPVDDARSALPDSLDLGPHGIILLAVKAYDAADAASAIAGTIRGDTPVVCLCNGIGAEEALAAALGEKRVVPATLTTAVQVLSPGTIRIERERGLGLAAGPVADSIAPRLVSAGLQVRIYSDSAAMKWSKVPTNIVANASSAVLGWTAAQTMAHRGLVRLEIEAIRETFRVMRRLGHAPVNLPGVPVRWLSLAVFLPARWIDRRLARLVARGRGDKLPSFHHDIGRGRSEVRWLNGAVVEAGERAGLPTPANRVLLHTLLDLVEGRAHAADWSGRADRLLERARREGVPGI